MYRRSCQSGWTFTGLVSVLTVAGIFLTVAFKLAPAYADFYTLKDIMEATAQDRELLSKKKHDIENGIAKRMRINNLSLPKDYLTIIKDKGNVNLDVDYEIRTPIFFNVDAVVSFKQRFTGKELD